MIIEIDEKDFREIQDKIGEIRAEVLKAKMERFIGCIGRLDTIISRANEITALLNNAVINDDKEALPGFVDDPTPHDTTKFIERYDYWMCEKCGYVRDANIWPSMLDIDGKNTFLMCPGCGLEIIELVPLVREGG